MEWYDDRMNLRNLAEAVIDEDGEIDTVEFLEKPWKWSENWKYFQEHDNLKGFDYL